MSPRRTRAVRIFIAGVVLLLSEAASHAQTSQATLQGQVISQATGQPVFRAVVIERNLQTNSQAYRYTNEEGIYYFPALLPGNYSVRVDALGYQPEERSAVELTVASRIELNFALKAGENVPAPASTAPPAAGASASNILSVMYGSDAAVPLALMVRLPVQATETLIGTLSRLIGERAILELPLSGRDVYTLLVLQPGVTSDNATSRGLGFSVNGQRVGSSNFLLDGVDNNDLLVTGPATSVSADAVKEYRMSTNNFTAEFGRASGFIANAITRTGTNALHGTLFEFFNHDRLNANSFAYNWQEVRRPPFRQNQFGGSFGGPLRRDRLFFFGNAERFQSSSQSQPGTFLVPSQELIDLIPSGSPARELLTIVPPPVGEPVPDFFIIRQKTFVIPAVQRNTLALGRVDFSSADGRHHLSGRYAFSQQGTENFFFSVYPGLNAPLTVRGQNLSANYTRDLFGGANELKFGYSRNTVQLLRPHPDLPSIYSADGLISPAGILLPGMESSFDYVVRDTVLHVVENFSRLRGRHALGMGVEWRLGLTDSFSTTFSGGQYVFPAGIDFLLGGPPLSLFLPVSRFTGLPPTQDEYWRFYRQGEWAAFFQDNIKMTRRLTLNLGLRYEYFGVPVTRRGTPDANFIFGPGSNVEERIASGGWRSGLLYEEDRNNFAPRFGFAADLQGDGKSVLRGGYGIFFDRIFNNIWLNLRNNNFPIQCIVRPQTTEENSGCNIPVTPVPFTFAIPAGQGLPPLNPASVVNTSTALVDSNSRTPYSQSWFLGFQRELTRNLILEVNQTGSLGRKLITGDGINRPRSVTPTPANPHGRFNPRYGDMLYYATQGHSNHYAIEAALDRRWSKGVQFQLSYTYARSKDVQSDPLIVPGQTGSSGLSSRLAASNLGNSPSFFRQFDPSKDYGNSDFDQRHNLVLNFVAQAPHFSGWAKLLNGWQISGLVGVRSGFPFTVMVPPDGVAGERGIANRADFTGGSLSEAFLSKRSPVRGGVQMLDPGKFQAPTGNRIGNLQRNSLYGPGFWNADFAIGRSFAFPFMAERTQLQFRAEFFNLFNHTNLANPDRTLISDSFGAALFGRQGFGSALPSVSPLNEQPRRIQFAVKIYF